MTEQERAELIVLRLAGGLLAGVVVGVYARLVI
jgi:hypothetical protein